VWEEEDNCSPPLAQEREAVLDHYFDDIAVERVEHGEAWQRISALPHLFTLASGRPERSASSAGPQPNKR
jgi:hypothetical protein